MASDNFIGALHAASGAKRRPVLQTFGARQQLDREHVFGVLDDRPQFNRGRHPHRHMVFLSAGGGKIIHTRGMREDF